MANRKVKEHRDIKASRVKVGDLLLFGERPFIRTREVTAIEQRGTENHPFRIIRVRGHEQGAGLHYRDGEKVRVAK